MTDDPQCSAKLSDPQRWRCEAEIVLDVPMLTPTGNALSGRHWRARYGMRNQWRHALWALALEAGVRAPKYPRVEILIERHSWRPIRDVDNLYAGLKPVLDGMVAAELLLDDSSDVVTSLKVVQVKALHSGSRTVIRIRPCPPPSGSSSPTSGPAPP